MADAQNNEQLPGNYRTTRLSRSKSAGEWELTGHYRIGTKTNYVGLKTPDGREVQILPATNQQMSIDKDVDAVATYKWEDAVWTPDDNNHRIYTFALDGDLYAAVLNRWTQGIRGEEGYTMHYAGPVKTNVYYDDCGIPRQGYEPNCVPTPEEPNRDDEE